MSAPGVPQGFVVQSANQQILASWNLSAGADSYTVQRSLDNITYTTVATISGSPLATQYLDTAVTLCQQYWYKVAASTTGVFSSYTLSQSEVPVPVGEMCLSQIRLQAMQRADRVNSNFVTMSEWRNYINKSMFELYDLLVTTYEDYYIAPPITFNTIAGQQLYALPNGSNSFQDASGSTIIPQAMYKLSGVDLSLNTAQNAWITINKFNLIDRNNYVYPTAGSTIFGMYNIRYRMIGNNIEFIPFPASGQMFRLWYIPRLTELLKDTDTTTTGISGWIEYVVVRAAKYALDKEESDSSKLDTEILFLKSRIEEAAANRDAGQPDTISNTRNSNNLWGTGPGWTGSGAGW